MAFNKATKAAATIKIAVCGPSGSGKTYSSLMLAKGLGGSVAVVDTEYGSASLYADKFDFDTWDETDPQGYPPEYFIRAIREAEKAGYGTIIIDSLSHEWSGRGGCLEIQSRLAQTKYRGNSYMAWGEVTPRHQALVDAIQATRMNVIVTMRSKMDYALGKGEDGKNRVDRLGLAPVQREGMDYEFAILFDIDRDSHMANAGKDRTSMFATPHLISEETGERIRAWMTSEPATRPERKENTEEPAPETAPESVQTPLEAEDGALRAKKYLKAFLVRKVGEGAEKKHVLKFFADLLKTDTVKELDEFTDIELRICGNELKATLSRSNQ